MDLIFGYLAGLLTLINPCVLPVLPIVLATALQSNRWGPVALAAGMSLAFVTLGVTVSAFGFALGITNQGISNIAAIMMVGFGAMLLIPQLGDVFSRLTAGMAQGADATLDDVDRSGLVGQFLGGILLGAVWSPCIGPTLGGAIALASGGGSLVWATAIMISFAGGVSTIIFALAYGARTVLQRRAAAMRKLAGKARPVMGIIFVLVGLMILFRVHHMIEIWAVQNLPYWIQDLSVRY
ncbi:MAG: cytochrome c biogenesis CcdA family protein [Planktomarina sp.]